jgi:hypothetical protein
MRGEIMRREMAGSTNSNMQAACMQSFNRRACAGQLQRAVLWGSAIVELWGPATSSPK